MAGYPIAYVFIISLHLLWLGRYFDEISQDTGKYCFGVEDTLRALELGSVETLICWENLDIQRYVLKNHTNAEEKVLHLTPEQEKDKTHFTDKEVNIKIIESCRFIVRYSQKYNTRHMLQCFFLFWFQSGVELELVECQPLLEWLANNYKSFGATLEIITDKSQEGSQFVRGFGGIGGESFFLLAYYHCFSFHGEQSPSLHLIIKYVYAK